MTTRELLGETLGTFLLVLFGCGAVAVSVLFGMHQGVMPVALAWGVGAMLSIYLTHHLSCAHLNPAVSFAMALAGRMPWRKLPGYVAAHFAGAILAGFTVYALFAPSIFAYEQAHYIVRGSSESIRTAENVALLDSRQLFGYIAKYASNCSVYSDRPEAASDRD